MGKGFVAGLLVLTCLGATASVLAGNAPIARASAGFKWVTVSNTSNTVLLSVEGTIYPAIVWVQVDDKNDSNQANGGINLQNCGNTLVTYVHRGATVQCKVWPGRLLIANSKLNCTETGFFQVKE